jgi:hypothetical protein
MKYELRFVYHDTRCREFVSEMEEYLKLIYITPFKSSRRLCPLSSFANVLQAFVNASNYITDLPCVLFYFYIIISVHYFNKLLTLTLI